MLKVDYKLIYDILDEKKQSLLRFGNIYPFGTKLPEDNVKNMVKDIPMPTQQVFIMSFVWASKFSGSHGTSPNDVTFALNSYFTSQSSLQRNHQDFY